jgi:hypothetical protein
MGSDVGAARARAGKRPKRAAVKDFMVNVLGAFLGKNECKSCKESVEAE